MKRFAVVLAILAAPLLMAVDSRAASVQQSGEELRASTVCQNATGTAQQTLTFAAPGPNCFWVVDNIDNGSGATTAPAVTILTTTSTGFAANWKGYLVQPASATGVNSSVVFANGLRALPGNAVTFVSNAAVTNINFMLNACAHQVCL
jgi:hypothetical protein